MQFDLFEFKCHEKANCVVFADFRKISLEQNLEFLSMVYRFALEISTALFSPC